MVEEKFERVANYCLNINKEIDMIAHSCGLHHAREFRREHVRIAGAAGPNFTNSRDVLMPAVQRFRSLKSFTANGVVGDPRRASRAT